MGRIETSSTDANNFLFDECPLVVQCHFGNILHSDRNLLGGVVQNRAKVDHLTRKFHVREADLSYQINGFPVGMVTVHYSHLAVQHTADSVGFEAWVEVDPYLGRFARLQNDVLLVHEIRRYNLEGEVERESRPACHFESLRNRSKRHILDPLVLEIELLVAKDEVGLDELTLYRHGLENVGFALGAYLAHQLELFTYLALLGAVSDKLEVAPVLRRNRF